MASFGKNTMKNEDGPKEMVLKGDILDGWKRLYVMRYPHSHRMTVSMGSQCMSRWSKPMGESGKNEYFIKMVSSDHIEAYLTNQGRVWLRDLMARETSMQLNPFPFEGSKIIQMSASNCHLVLMDDRLNVYTLNYELIEHENRLRGLESDPFEPEYRLTQSVISLKMDSSIFMNDPDALIVDIHASNHGQTYFLTSGGSLYAMGSFLVQSKNQKSDPKSSTKEIRKMKRKMFFRKKKAMKSNANRRSIRVPLHVNTNDRSIHKIDQIFMSGVSSEMVYFYPNSRSLYLEGSFKLESPEMIGWIGSSQYSLNEDGLIRVTESGSTRFMNPEIFSHETISQTRFILPSRTILVETKESNHWYVWGYARNSIVKSFYEMIPKVKSMIPVKIPDDITIPVKLEIKGCKIVDICLDQRIETNCIGFQIE